jgi:putative methyltransferase (TIGR04325 family)
MTRLKRAARALTPPLLWSLAHKVKTKCGVGVFEGPVASWEEAVARSDGWDAPEIAAKTLASSLKVRDGVIAFQEDGVSYDSIQYSTTILAFLLLALSRNKERLHILDFGGALGTHYFQKPSDLTPIV